MRLAAIIGRLAGNIRSPVADGLVLVGFLALVSAVWRESDLYRFAGVALLAWGLVIYGFLEKEFRPSIGTMGVLCVAWAVYVVLRIGLVMGLKPVTSAGSAEGIYLFCITYMTMGHVFFVYRGLLTKFLMLFMAISLAGLAFTIPFHTIVENPAARTFFLAHNNVIHASVGGGFIALAAVFLGIHLDRRPALTRRQRAIGLAACTLAILLCLIGIWGAKSKGVWLALVLSLPLIFVGSLSGLPRGRRLKAAGATALVTAVALALLGAHAWQVVGPFVDSTGALLYNIFDKEAFAGVVADAVRSGNVPLSLAQRLELWSKALDIWSRDWVLGVGVFWRTLWDAPDAVKVPFNLFHNGFLEVGVRYGLLGLAFYACLTVWSLRQSALCARNGLIARELHGFHVVSMVFFLLTLLTNSNNRIAIGESFFLVSFSFGFCCYYLLQWEDWEKAKQSEDTDIESLEALPPGTIAAPAVQ